MVDSKESDKAPVSIRLPKSESVGSQPLLNADGFAVLDRDSLYKLFHNDPDAVRRIAPLLVPDDDMEQS